MKNTTQGFWTQENYSGLHISHISYCKIFIQFGLIYNAGQFKYSLHLMNYCGGILVIFQVLPIFLVRSHQYLTVKIGFINFWAIFIFLCISKGCWYLKVFEIRFKSPGVHLTELLLGAHGLSGWQVGPGPICQRHRGLGGDFTGDNRRRRPDLVGE